MYYLADINDQVGDFGSSSIVIMLQKISQQQDMNVLRHFLNHGFSTDINDLISELESVDYGYGELEDAVEEIIEGLRNCEEIAILHQGYQ
jgi:ACT domain-containing protein